MSKTKLLTSVAATAVGLALGMGAPASAQEIVGRLITKTDTNPFFVKMKEGAEAKADELGMELQAFAGKYDGDNEGQVEAIESLHRRRRQGHPDHAVRLGRDRPGGRARARCRHPGDRPRHPARAADAADATFATDNFKAGELIGQWAAAKLGDAAEDAKIAMLDLSEAGVSVDVQRDQGFLTGFGIDVGNPNRIGDEDDHRIVGHDVTHGAEEGGRTAMENLLQQDPGVNLVYTINEPAAAGAYEALRSFGLDEQASDRLDRRRLSRRPERRRWRDRRDLDAVPAGDGRDGGRGGQGSSPRPARSPRRPRARSSSTPASSWSPTTPSRASPRSAPGGARKVLGMRRKSLV